MPVRTGKDTKGCFARYGSSGKKYHYTCGNVKSRESAKSKAAKQGRAIEASKWRKSK
jgi:hypothetical protein